MYCFVVLAGIPADIYDGIISAGSKKLAAGEGAVISKPLKLAVEGKYKYKQSYTGELIAKLEDGVVKALAGAPNRKIYIMLLYVNYESDSTAMLCRRFMSFALPCRLNPLNLAGLTNKQKREQKNRLIGTIVTAAVRMRRSLKVIENELSSGANRTPLLLPCRNFRSRYLITLLDETGHEIAVSREAEKAIRKFSDKFQQRHPRVTLGRDHKRYFRDERSLIFKTPGNARHGWHREAEGHQAECLLGSVARLGAPYDPKFHYDCQYEGCLISGVFPNCHDVEINVSSCSHVNIAPNDYVRG